MNESFWNGFEKQALSSDLARRAAAAALKKSRAATNHIPKVPGYEGTEAVQFLHDLASKRGDQAERFGAYASKKIVKEKAHAVDAAKAAADKIRREAAAAAQRAEAAAAAKKKNDAVLGTLSGMGDDMAIRNLLRKIG
jgi:hypothetical protein